MIIWEFVVHTNLIILITGMIGADIVVLDLVVTLLKDHGLQELYALSIISTGVKNKNLILIITLNCL